MFFPPESDVPVAQLTLAGRNLLARSVLPRGKLSGTDPDSPLVTFKLVGFAVGDGGYKLDNPLQISTVNDQTTQAEATIAILDNRFDVNDKIVINGVSFPVGIQVVASGTATGGTERGGVVPGHDDGVAPPNALFFGGTLTDAPNTFAVGAHIGQRLRLVGGTLAGLDELIVDNTADSVEIGLIDDPTFGTTGKSWTQAGSGGLPLLLVPDATTDYQIITNAPGAGTWVPGDTLEETAENLANAINSSPEPLVQNVVRAEVSGAIVTVKALIAGEEGNLNTLVEFDAGGFAFNNFGITPGTGFLAGGISPSLENPRFPATAPTDVEDFFDIEIPNLQAVSLVCRVDQTEGNFGLGEVGVYVDITDSVNPAEIGSRILYAISHFPIVAKNLNSVFVTRVITQY